MGAVWLASLIAGTHDTGRAIKAAQRADLHGYGAGAKGMQAPAATGSRWQFDSA
jgi:membrane-bound lytic murein transglycosylase